MEQFKRVLERFMPQEGADEGEQAAAADEAAAAGGAQGEAAAAAGEASDADSDEEGGGDAGNMRVQLFECKHTVGQCVWTFAFGSAGDARGRSGRLAV